MKRNQGFTLIELIIVIVILGILAVTAAPRFLNLSGDARGATLDAVKASLQSASSLVYGKAVIAGVQNQATATVVNKGSDTIAVVYGYPAATTGVAADLLDVADFTIEAGDDTKYFDSVAADFVVFPTGFAPSDASEDNACHVVYKASTGIDVKPVIKVYKDGC
tara:strand:- start:180 stop:671 length:492 start_codon:yes stop_codon:yes gene_type:complete